MAQLVRESLLHPEPRMVALAIIEGRGPRTAAAGAHAVGRWVRRKMRFINEPVEMLHRPEWQLKEIAANGFCWGDCDDASMLVAAIGSAAGLDARLTAIRPPSFGDFMHVFCELGYQGDWSVIDPTSPYKAPEDWDRMTVTIF